jgi:hypothetical protein
LAAEIPSARFQEKENPYFFTFRADTPQRASRGTAQTTVAARRRLW